MQAVFTCSGFILIVSLMFVAVDSRHSRSLSDQGGVIAVYNVEWGGDATKPPPLITAIWPDGYAVWSHDSLNGGPPYLSGKCDRNRIQNLFETLHKEGLFEEGSKDPDSWLQFNAHSDVTCISIIHRGSHVSMKSHHELIESGGLSTAIEGTALLLQGRKRNDVLKQQRAEYLLFRALWSETRGRINGLIPVDRRAWQGRIVDKEGIMWLEE